MTTDRELLEWAAKAAGIEFYVPDGEKQISLNLNGQEDFLKLEVTRRA